MQEVTVTAIYSRLEASEEAHRLINPHTCDNHIYVASHDLSSDTP